MSNEGFEFFNSLFKVTNANFTVISKRLFYIKDLETASLKNSFFHICKPIKLSRVINNLNMKISVKSNEEESRHLHREIYLKTLSDITGEYLHRTISSYNSNCACGRLSKKELMVIKLKRL